jgi:aminoglycoside phosphotransferase (APT) family kinase protein
LEKLERLSAHPWHGWLAAVLPADAERVRVNEVELAATLSGAGLELVEEHPDVEIAPPQHLRGDARFAIVSVGLRFRGERSRFVRARRRLLGSLQVGRSAQRARREMLRRGYASAEVISWDLEHPVRLGARRSRRRALRAAELLPLGAVVVGRRSSHPPTVLEAAVEGAEPATSGPLRANQALVRATGLIVIGEQEVMRISIGTARRHLHHQRRVLDLLRAARPADSVAARVPWPVAHGTAGVAEWSLERRLQGAEPSPPLDRRLVAECSDFLVALHKAGDGRKSQGSLLEAAELVGSVCDPERGRELLAVAERLETGLADLPRGFGHGDFWSGNLLADGERLVGVVDWAAAGSDRLPLVDLIHLQLSEHRWATNESLGRPLVEEMLPWAQRGGDEHARSYCQQLGFEPNPERLEALVIAYWLDRVAHELEAYSDRREPRWLSLNVDPVLRTLEHNDWKLRLEIIPASTRRSGAAR